MQEAKKFIIANLSFVIKIWARIAIRTLIHLLWLHDDQCISDLYLHLLGLGVVVLHRHAAHIADDPIRARLAQLVD